MRETDLAAPVVAFLEGQGYAVKSEVGACDLVAVRGGEPPVVVELKRRFSFDLLLQGVDRLAVADTVYLAFPAETAGDAWKRRRKSVLKTCRRLGLGILVLRARPEGGYAVLPELDPGPYRPRPDTRRRGRLLKEFATRVGDPNTAGSTGVKIVTAYRQDALRIAAALAGDAVLPVADLRPLARSVPAARLLQQNVYGWFERERRGHYRLSPAGAAALETWGQAIRDLAAEAQCAGM
ncbi:hypothetical protein GCM10017083_22330 [Thalassobaculum fulvum]|uniref:Uncharacterized protein n=1 Tax=Thalassobaculum fulvum TaxID=1633335 RepID=A0A918XSG9_9PROT|nr:DUF2161 family putative PD-(D/E)XK-type phosphodiesterase [Thalassobaculum fulvum]GHD49725.1 hypothetical protein GCM10017083_22330 [Thalassobaculum fulvum]